MHLRVLLALAIAATLVPQEPQRPPTFRTGAELVRVDVTVIDSKGHPVTTLTADAFAVEEDGVPQKIQSFKFVEHTGQPVAGDDLSLTITSPSHAATELARDDLRVFVIYWDEYHIHPLTGAERMRTEVAHFIRTMTGPTDIIALMDPWTPTSDLRFTRDRDELVFAAGKLLGRQGVYQPPRNGAEENQMRHATSVPLARAEVALSALKSAMMHVGSLRQGRTSFIYVGSDFSVGMDSFLTTQELINAANDANVAFYSISPEGLQIRGGNRAGTLRDLASNTGGEAIRSNAPSHAFRRVVDQAGGSYLLGYSPEPQRFDGKFHKIKVSLKNSRGDVRARNGYWAPDLAAMTRARAVAAESVLAPEISAAFNELVRLDRPGTMAPGWTVQSILAPDPPVASLALTAPRLWRIQRPGELPIVMSDAPPPPFTGRIFTREDRLIIRFAMTGPLGPQAVVSVRLVDRRGKKLTDIPFTPERTRPTEWVIDLPLTSIARGDYAVEIAGVQGEVRTAAYLPLRIVAN
ncbi:MAG: VWA domain-containing protein [Vicinamibacterales bacterium]